MKRYLSLLGLSFLPALLIAVPAHAETVASGACLTTYESALIADALTNGPYHNSGGSPSVGDFTPSVFVAGATGPTGAFIGCTV